MMENTVQTFDNPDYGKIRVALINGTAWFSRKDVSKALDSNPGMEAKKKLAECFKAIKTRRFTVSYIINGRKDAGEGFRQAVKAFMPGRWMTFVTIEGIGALARLTGSKDMRLFYEWAVETVLPQLDVNKGYDGTAFDPVTTAQENDGGGNNNTARTPDSSGLQVFQNTELGKLRTTIIDGEPWFVGKDAATALGYSNTKDAIIKHVDDDDRKILRSQNTTLEKIPNRGIAIINESGLYSLIFASKLPTARKFKHWVTAKVLPALRKNGTYSVTGRTRTGTDSKPEADVNAKADEIRLFTAMMECMDRSLHLSKQAKADMIRSKFEALGLQMPEVKTNEVATGYAFQLISEDNTDLTTNRFFELLYLTGMATKPKLLGYIESPDKEVYSCELINEGRNYGVNMWSEEKGCYIPCFYKDRFYDLYVRLILRSKDFD